ncbi:hypothetical protein QF046_002517 [Microbacterium sp. W4I4]|uniref:hypothetical protein n=1 Tax=Microbacterium sp. W4I4 TaxID=3042295 RepID=UPI00277EB118|nr:hypothetical protein [Microbacterium sp. W4I4]MDQ0614876.1 hypothetical protein [Microbacterium sp. W4I4]
MYEYLNAASMMESRRTAELNRQLEIRRIALERRAERHTAAPRLTRAERISAGIRRALLPTARRTRAPRHA